MLFLLFEPQQICANIKNQPKSITCAAFPAINLFLDNTDYEWVDLIDEEMNNYKRLKIATTSERFNLIGGTNIGSTLIEGRSVVYL